MKKIFLAKRNALLSGRGATWGGVALGVVLLLFLLKAVAPDIFWGMFSPVFSASDAASTYVRSVVTGVTSAASLSLQNDLLVQENYSLASKNKELTQKLADVTKLLNVNSVGTVSGVLAGVVARPPESPYDTLVLAAGTQQGVAIGMEAFADDNVPIGTVSAVSEHFSQVTLFSSPNATVYGWVGNASTPLTLTGSGAGTLTAKVSRAVGVKVGDVVFVPGPGKLPVGTVIAVDGDPLSPAVTLRIQPAANVFSISWVVLRASGAVPVSFATSTLPL